MKKYQQLFGVLLAAVMCLCVGVWFGMNLVADSGKSQPIKDSAVIVGDSDVAARIKSQFPDMGNIEVSDSVISGLKEVAIKQTGEVFYTDISGKYIVIGLITDKEGRNYTKERMDILKKDIFGKSMQGVDKSVALKIGNGSNEVIEFTDVDCPYCRQAETFFDAADSNATRYIFFTPIDSLHPEAAKKSVHILCSEDKAGEYNKIIKGEQVKYIECDEGKALLETHRKTGELLGVKGTPQFFINGVQYTGADPAIYEAIRKK